MNAKEWYFSLTDNEIIRKSYSEYDFKVMEQYANEKVKEALKITKVDHVCSKCGEEILNNS